MTKGAKGPRPAGLKSMTLSYNSRQYKALPSPAFWQVKTSPYRTYPPMKHARSVIYKPLRWLALLCALTVLSSHADEYSDTSQLVKTNKFTEALAKVDSYLGRKPADPHMRFLKGVIQRNLGKQAEAINTFTQLTLDYPELPEPYNNLAVIYADQDQYDKARVTLEMAIRTNPNYATAHENLGDVYVRLASQAYNKALLLDSSNTTVQPKLALTLDVFKPRPAVK
jgi:tetratricopeptide (TPR) repeat protein